MRSTVILAMLLLALCLMFQSVSVAEGAQYLTVNGQDVGSITLELGQSRTVEIVSTDSTSYIAYAGFDNGIVLGDFPDPEIKQEAGSSASADPHNEPAFYGCLCIAAGAPSPGVHFVFQYKAMQVGETDVKLYQNNPPPSAGPLIDSVHITVIPLQPVAMGSAWTYQGRLMDANKPADGLYDLQFKLYDNADPVFAAQQGSTLNKDDVDVIDGYFTVELDFGAGVFDGDSVWLETAVRPGDSNEPNAFVTLSPRQELTPTLYAVYAENAGGDGDWKVNGNDMYSLPSGNVGIGTTNPQSRLSVGRTGSAGTGVHGHGSQIGVFGHCNPGAYGTGVHGEGYYGVAGFENSDIGGYGVYGEGHIGVHGYSTEGWGVYGKSDSGYAGYFHGNCYIHNGQITIPAMISYPWPSGGYNVKIFDGTLFFETSSSRYKENIQPCRAEFSKILQAEPRSYTCAKTGRREIGFIAEEFDDLGLCELVIYDQEGRPDGVAYQMISLYLLEVLKDEVETSREQQEAINQLEQKNRKLEERVEALERMMERQQSALAKLVQ